jgi:hypothetical protein
MLSDLAEAIESCQWRDLRSIPDCCVGSHPGMPGNNFQESTAWPLFHEPTPNDRIPDCGHSKVISQIRNAIEGDDGSAIICLLTFVPRGLLLNEEGDFKTYFFTISGGFDRLTSRSEQSDTSFRHK